MSQSTVATFVASPITKPIDSNEVINELINNRARHCVMSSHTPSVQMYFTLRQKIESSSVAWLEEFLSLGGLERLLDTLCHMTGNEFTNFSDAILQLDCLACVRAVLNRKTGMEFVLQCSENIEKLVTVLSTGNAMPKKQIFELLTAICGYSNTGLHLVMDALNTYKKSANKKHKLSLVLSELTQTDVAVSYKTAVLSFINCFVNCFPDLCDRVRLRTELNGLGLCAILTQYQKLDFDADLHVQMEIYETHRYKDDVAIDRQTQVDTDDSSQLFDLIYSKVFGRPKHTHFLQILQDLAMLEVAHKNDSESKWEKISDLVHTIVTKNDTEIQCLDSVHVNCVTCEHCCDTTKCTTDTLSHSTIKCGGDSTLKNNATPLAMAKEILDLTPENDVIKKDSVDMENDVTISDGSRPSCSMLPLRWAPITKDNLREFDKPTIWDKLPLYQQTLQTNAQQLEQLFCHHSHKDNWDEVQLIGDDSSLRLNLLLHRLDMTAEDLSHAILTNDVNLNTWTLRYLTHALPTIEEIESLHRYTGPTTALSQPDLLLLRLSKSSDYRKLIQSQLTVREMAARLQTLRNDIEYITRACRAIVDCKSLPRFLHLALDAGNFLNFDQHNGQATGFKLSSLSRLDEVKSSTPRTTLLSHLVSIATANDASVFRFTAELSTLDKASQLNMAELNAEIDVMEKKWRRLEIDLSNSHPNILNMLDTAIEMVNQDMYTLQSGLCELKVTTDRLANYVCEDIDTFNMAACFKDIAHFINSIQRYRIELKLSKKDTSASMNHASMNRVTEIKDSARDRKMTLEFGREAGASSSFVEDRSSIIDGVLSEVHRGNFHPSNTPDACLTPNNESLPWELSCISPGAFGASSPMWVKPPLAKIETFSEFNESAALKCATSSVNDLLDSPPTAPNFPNPAPLVATPNHVRRKLSTLYRSYSDLDLTLKSGQKWRGNNHGKTTFVKRQTSLDPLDLSVDNRSPPAILVNGPTVKIPLVPISNRQDCHVSSKDFTTLSDGHNLMTKSRSQEFKVPLSKAYVNAGVAGNKLESNFKRQYRAPVSNGLDPTRGSKKRASIMGNIVNRFTRVVLKSKGESDGKSRWSKRERKNVGKNESKDVRDVLDKLDENRKKVKEVKESKKLKNNSDSNKENRSDRLSFKARFGRNRANGDIKGVKWNNLKEKNDNLLRDRVNNVAVLDHSVILENEKLV